MKKCYLFMLSLAAVIALPGCGNNDNETPPPDEPQISTLTVTASDIEGLPAAVTTVKVHLDSHLSSTDMLLILGDVLVEAPLANGGFTVTLDMVVPDDKLEDYAFLTYAEVVSGAADPKVNSVYFACYEGDAFLGLAVRSSEDWNNWSTIGGTAYAWYYYFDKACSFSGSTPVDFFDLTFEAGWNIQTEELIGRQYTFTNNPLESLGWKFFPLSLT